MAATNVLSQSADVHASNFKNWSSKDSLAINEDKLDSLKVLDPDDPLMKRFQDALKDHLLRIDLRLSQDITQLQAATKEAAKKREEKGAEMYEAQREISQQQNSIEKFRKNLEEVTHSREELEHQISGAKLKKNNIRQESEKERRVMEELTRKMDNLLSESKQFLEFEKEISNHLIVAKRMTEKDANVQRDLIRQKQEADYILWKLSGQVWKIEKEIEDLGGHMEMKNEERLAIGQTIADADADLEAIQRERKSLVGAWNSVVGKILQRDKVNDQLNAERMKIRESFKTLQSQIEKTKKDTVKEMENNERLTSIQAKLEEDIQCNQSRMTVDREKSDVLEYKTLEIAKLAEKNEDDYEAALFEYQKLMNEEKCIDKEFEKLCGQKNLLEDEILMKLEDKVTNDKAVKHLNKILSEAKETVTQLELSMIQTENQYGKNILELERLKNFVAIEKGDFEELCQSNSLKEKDLDKIRVELSRLDLLIEKKQKKIVDMKKKIEEMNLLRGGTDMSVHDLKISGLEKNIEEIEAKNHESKQYWLRQESFMVNLTQERNSQLEELNRLNKLITIMDQKNIKLEYEIEKEKKEETRIDRRMNQLRQRLQQTNSILAEQKELRENLQDKNFIIKDEYEKSLHADEMELAKLQNEIKDLSNEKLQLEENLHSAHHEYFSWEKKLKIAADTSKTIKNERNAGGDVAIMKSEIHKMEIRLSHLRKAQEKMIRDMEFCVSRRETIIDIALAKEKKNPKGMHNKRVMFRKRMDGRRMKIKQMIKETKSIEGKIQELESEKLKLQEELNENKKSLDSCTSSIPAIDRQIFENELIKGHKLECLVRKQRKVLMLQKVREGKYKMLIKSETALTDSLEKQKSIKLNLTEIMEQTKQDFPHLNDDVRRIQLTLQST